MKKILTVYTGGTICSFENEYNRSLDISGAKRVIERNLEKTSFRYRNFSENMFESLSLDVSTFSENMTVSKLSYIIKGIKESDLSSYRGIIILHGTDTLAYSAAIFAMSFPDIDIPVMIVSANRPSDDKLSNANDNFRTATELILKGIAPNVYVPYRNSDGKIWLHLGSRIMQCENFSEDFRSADSAFPVKRFNLRKKDYERCRYFSKKRLSGEIAEKISGSVYLDDKSVSLIIPYTGMNYERLNFDRVCAIIHGTYHSGTICTERSSAGESYGNNSIIYLTEKTDADIYIAPSVLSSHQYSTVFDAVNNGGVIPLNMTRESAYAKALVGAGTGLSGEKLREFMTKSEINNEFV